MVNVPEQFRPVMPFAYPADNAHEFERWYFDNYTAQPDINSVYLPIFWTAYYVKHDISKNEHNSINLCFSTLQKWLNENLQTGISYYTIVQHDDGILHELSNFDVKIFSMGGGKIDYALPLLAQPHKWKFNNERIYLASFIGGITHPIRQQLKTLFDHDDDILFSDRKIGLNTYCDIMSRSIFVLCPRGYGPTSFRIQEAIQYGAIPVYISDTFIDPYGFNFNLFGLKVSPDEIGTLKTLLKHLVSINYHLKDQRVPISEEYTYTGCRDMITRALRGYWSSKSIS